VIPTTLTGVLVFLASVGPGYVYVQVIERWRPLAQRSTFRETIEVIVAGSLATTVGVTVALIVGKQTGLLDVVALSRHPGNYLATHPARTGAALLVVLAVSYGAAWAVPRFAPGKGARVYPDSGWYGAFERRLPKGFGIVATVELKDGRSVAGAVSSFTAEQTPIDDRELVLAAPPGKAMAVRMPNGATSELNDQFILLRGDLVAYVSASYAPLESSAATPAWPRERRKRLPAWRRDEAYIRLLIAWWRAWRAARGSG
jgi:hypothetical protein